MIKVTLKDNSVKEFEKPMSIIDIAKKISELTTQLVIFLAISSLINNIEGNIQKN